MLFTKQTNWIMLISLILATSVFAADCMDNATTQSQMNECSQLKSNQADVELNQVYQQVLALAKNDPVATKKIRAAEQAWIKYRDAQIEMYYPPRSNGWYGTAQPMCRNNIYVTLTQKRVSELKEWLKKPQEGDVCAW